MKENTQLGRKRLRWNDVKTILEKENRFCNDNVILQLDYVFGAGGKFETVYRDPVIVQVSSYDTDFSMYRARYFGSQDNMRSAMAVPDMELVRPPSKLARAGRINAEGISVLYGANEKKVALSEVRPPIGSYVVIFRVNIIDEIRLLNIEELKNTLIHNFDTNIDEYSPGKFISRFEDQMSIPVMREDESTEYVVTQVISDYLAENRKLDIDGLIYKSAQKNEKEGKNIVLFHNSSLVRSFNESDVDRLLKKLKVDYSNIFDGKSPSEVRDSYLKSCNNGDQDRDNKVKVEIDIDSLSVYKVLSANFDTKPKID